MRLGGLICQRYNGKSLESIHGCVGRCYSPASRLVWNTNVAVAQIQNDLVDAEDIVVLEQKVEEADANAKAIISMEKDIEYMKQTLDRIEGSLQNDSGFVPGLLVDALRTAVKPPEESHESPSQSDQTRLRTVKKTLKT